MQTIEPYKGTRDFYPEDKYIQNYMFGVFADVVKKYGYLEYGAPILELSSLYQSKSSDEIISEQTYIFKDRGNREVVMRPEMTPSLARMVARQRQELVQPIRWFSIPNLFRYERPQKGRLREHWQLNVDMFGVEGIPAEHEMLSIIQDIMVAFGATKDDYIIRISDRRIINEIFQQLKLNENQIPLIVALIDKYHKLGSSAFLAEVKHHLTKEQINSGLDHSLAALMQVKDIGELSDMFSLETTYELNKLIEKLEESDQVKVVFDPAIIRGFNYYTGIVFEVYDNDPQNSRALCGGGRYDELMGLFGVEKLPTVGFGWGDVSMYEFLSSRDLLPKRETEKSLRVLLLGRIYFEASSIISAIRNNGIVVAVDMTDRSLDKKLKAADKDGFENCLIIGEQELKSKKFTLKNLKNKSQDQLTLSKIIEIFKKQ
jgi:histidyl-tRNA synthetase